MIRRLIFATAGSALMLSSMGAVADVWLGKNEELAIEASIAGVCGAVVNVRLEGRIEESFTRRLESLQQMIGRVRGAIREECSGQTVRSLVVEGYVGGKKVLVGESSELSDWRFVVREVKSFTDICSGGDQPELCRRRWAAYDFVRDLYLRTSLWDLRVTKYLDVSISQDLLWKSGDVEGKVTVIPIAELGDAAPDIALFLREQAVGLSESCGGALTESVGSEPNAYVSYTCQSEGVSYTNIMFAVRGAENVLVFSTRADDGENSPTTTMKILYDAAL